jgi:hypothetical protein
MNEPLTSDQRFALGEIAIVAHPRFHPEHTGMECQIIGELRLRKGIDSDGSSFCEPRYQIQYPNGAIYTAQPCQLRKRRPPRQDLEIVRWDQCPWQPKQVRT